jgi:hypothetical protein
LGLLDEQKPSNEYTPADFSENRRIESLRGRLGPEVIIKEEENASQIKIRST